MKNLETKKWVRVREEDFQQMEALRQAAREGRLFILPAEVMNQVAAGTAGTGLCPSVPSAEPLTQAAKREQSIQAILAYVARIDDCAEEAYRPYMQAIWEAILRSETLGDSFFLYRYENNRGEPNFYRVTAAVEILRQKGVYRKEFRPIDLHRRMEQLGSHDKPVSSYSSKDRYYLNKQERDELTNLASTFQSGQQSWTTCIKTADNQGKQTLK